MIKPRDLPLSTGTLPTSPKGRFTVSPHADQALILKAASIHARFHAPKPDEINRPRMSSPNLPIAELFPDLEWDILT